MANGIAGKRWRRAAVVLLGGVVAFIGGCIPIAGLRVPAGSDTSVVRASAPDNLPAPQALTLINYEDAPGADSPSTTIQQTPPEEIKTLPTPGPRAGTTTPNAPAPSADAEVMPIDLVTVLRLVNSANPTIEIARVRVREAYYRQREAELVWLPNLQAGPAYNRHDGLVQNALGLVFPTSKWNFFVGGGVAADFSLSDALFLPLVARRLTEAEAARARATTFDVQLEAALTYLELMELYGRVQVNAEAIAYAEEMLRFAEAGREAQMGKTPADVTRARTEVNLRREERIELEGRIAEVSARLAQLLLLRPTVDLRPADPTIVPIALIATDGPLDDLVAAGLLNRPELAASRALVGAALESWRQARTRPLLPRLQASYLAGDFGGGINDNTERFGGRGDGTVQAVWELHNLGVGDVARTRERRSQYREANLHVAEVQAQVAAEVTAAAKVVRTHERALATAQAAVQQAEETWRRLYEAAFGMVGRDRRYEPLEPLIAEQQVAEARNRYIANIIGYNKAQFRLYTAMGQPPLSALPQAVVRPVEIPSTPGPIAGPRPLPRIGLQAEPAK